MSYSIASPLVRSASPRRRPKRSRRLMSWLLVLVEGVIEAYTVRKHYHELADKGLRPEAALRIAFDLQGAKDPQFGSTAVAAKMEQD